MLQAIGLTSTRRRKHPPAVDDLTFEARAGQVTVLLGSSGAGKTTALRLVLGLEAGRGFTYFRGNPLHRIANPACEVGALLGDVPGHPARTARGQLRMLSAAVGVPASRADELLDVVGLAGLAQEPLGRLSLGMDRRLGLASALLGDPQTLVLDDPVRGLSPRDRSWLFALLRAHAAQGGTVLCTLREPKEAARIADRVVTLHEGRLLADQEAAEFSRTRLRPRVAVRTPHAARLSAVLAREARAERRSVEVVAVGGGALAVFGSSCAEVGETAFRHGVLVHRLTDEVGDTPPAPEPEPQPQSGPVAGTSPAPGPAPPVPSPASRALAPALPETSAPSATSAPPATPVPHPSLVPARTPTPALTSTPASTVTPTPTPTDSATPAAVPRAPRPVRSPRWPLRYEVRRLLGVRTCPLIALAAVAASLALCLALARTGATALKPHTVAAWPGFLPLPPAAFGAGLIGALSFGEEFRHPALASARGTVPRRLGLLLAKLGVTAAAAVTLAALVVAVDVQALRLAFGPELVALPSDWPALAAGWGALCVGCAWSGLLAAGVFRVTAAGVAAVLAVPVVVAPLAHKVLVVPAVRSIVGLPGRLRELAWVELPQEADRWLIAAMRLPAQPVGVALVLSLVALICAYVFTGLRRRAFW
ncbi:ATP-binding cassette domain-containing protein [Streptomyces pristinaespiralis]|uniref:ATP-binding cassette domain-containing protein n=1 Tax=Streptomyces pristinaespiralis TaxID=38300 RepID=UPI003836352F